MSSRYQHNQMSAVFAGLAILLAFAVQQPAFAEVNLNINILTDVGYARSDVSQKQPENWEYNFHPWKGRMNTSREDYALFWDLGVGIEPVWRMDITGWEFGVPVFSSFTLLGGGENGAFTTKKTVARTTVDWWNEVSLLEVKLQKKSPAIGISIGKKRWKFQFAVQKYKLFIQEFAGIDRYGDENTAKVIGDRRVERGVGQRVDMFYRLDKYDGSSGLSVGGYYERNGDQVWSIGISLKYSIPWL